MSELAQAIEEMRNMRESYNDLAKEINEDKKAIIHEMQLAGIDISSDASMAEVAERMREFTVLVKGNNDFVEGTYIRTLGDAAFAALTSKEMTAIESELPLSLTEAWMKQTNNTFLKRFSVPNAESISSDFLTGCNGLEYIDCPVYEHVPETHAFEDKLRYMVAKISFMITRGAYFYKLVYLKTDRFYANEGNIFSPLLSHLIGMIGGYIQVRGNYVSVPMLYDFRIEDAISANFNAGKYGDGVNMAGESMVIVSDYDDPDQPHFANNGEKMLWYFKHHFLYHDDGTATFADMSETTAPTLTLGANLRDLVMQDDEVVAYFTNRNWTIA